MSARAAAERTAAASAAGWPAAQAPAGPAGGPAAVPRPGRRRSLLSRVGVLRPLGPVPPAKLVGGALRIGVPTRRDVRIRHARHTIARGQGSLQSTGCAPCRTRRSFTRLKGREPKKPRSADMGRVGGLDGRQIAEQRPQIACVAPPQHRHQRASARHQCPDGLLGDLLPALAAVCGGLAGSRGQRPVQQQYALPGPRRQIAVRGAGEPEVGVQLAEDVLQAAGQRADVRRHGEAEPDRMPGRGIGVLPDDEDPHLVEGLLEGAQHVVAWPGDRCVPRRSPPAGSHPSRRSVRQRAQVPWPSPLRQCFGEVVQPRDHPTGRDPLPFNRWPALRPPGAAGHPTALPHRSITRCSGRLPALRLPPSSSLFLPLRQRRPPERTAHPADGRRAAASCRRRPRWRTPRRCDCRNTPLRGRCHRRTARP